MKSFTIWLAPSLVLSSPRPLPMGGLVLAAVSMPSWPHGPGSTWGAFEAAALRMRQACSQRSW